MSKDKNNEEMAVCPVGRFFMDLQSLSKRKSKFSGHMNKARIEFLKAIRSLVDERIEHFEKGSGSGKKKKVSKIKVE
jgi:hypothetical protein